MIVGGTMRRGWMVSFYMMGLAAAWSAAAEGQSGPSARATVTGVAFDSLAMRPFRGATVQIVAADSGVGTRTTTTDSLGRFAFNDVPLGVYLAGFFHAKLDSLGINPPVVRLDIRAPEPLRVPLAIPSAGTLVRAVCGEQSKTDSTGLMLGFLRGADNSMPRGGADFSVRWVELVLAAGQLRRETPRIEGKTGSTGLIAACGIPIGSPVIVQAGIGDLRSGSFEVTVPASGLLHRDVYVGRAERVAVSVGDSALADAPGPPVTELLRGTGRLRGTVLGPNRRPVSEARVTVWGTGLEVRTDAQGAFSLASLPAGTHTLEVRAVGFEPARRAVDITEGGNQTDVALESLGIQLETVRVVAERVYMGRRMAEFERRRKSGFGRFMDDRDIEKRNPMVLSDLLRTMPGVLVIPASSFGEDVLMRGGPGLGSGYCRPDVFLDGVRMTNDANFPFNSMIPVQQVYAMEVYSRSTSVPAEFSSMSGCGAIVIWTGQRSKLP